MLKLGLSQSPTSSMTLQAHLFVAASANIHRRIMPVDYGSYLLAASPPGFDLHHTLRDHFAASRYGSKAKPGADGNKANTNGVDVATNEKHRQSDNVDQSIAQSAECFDQDVTSLAEAFQFDLELGETTIEEHTEAKVSDKKNGKKRVSFADDLGKTLVSVRIMTESSDTPPRLHPQLLSSLTQGASAGVSVTPPLVINFSQPASDYLEFRKTIERNAVCLENVIVKDYNLIGTIKVRNESFHKSVFVRCTYDNWKTHVDTAATYMMAGQTSSQFDTFSFEINVPPTMDVHNKVQFAICYETNGKQYWDNNNNSNYEVLPADWRSTSEASVPPSSHSTDAQFVDWPNFAAWNNIDQSVPYY